MAVTIYGTVSDLPGWGLLGVGSILGESAFESYNPFPLGGSVQAYYLNKCIDGVTGEWHLWKTFFQDRTGVYYQSSGGQQFDAASYKVETIAYDREQL